MVDLWTTLVPLAIGSAVVPAQLVVTGVLLRSSRRSAVAWVAGMAAARLVQGVLFGLVFSEARTQSAPSTRIVAAGLLLALAALFFGTAMRQALVGDDSFAPPARWMSRVESMPATAALGAGAGYVAVTPEFWVFTLGAIGATADAQLGLAASALVFAAFVALTVGGNLAAIAFAAASPGRFAAASDRLGGWLGRNARAVTVVLSAAFGTWFLAKALSGLGLL